MPNITICRTLFCPKCAEKNWPYTTQRFIVFQGQREEAKVLTVTKRPWELEGQIGFTPHILTYVRKVKKGIKKGMIEVAYACAMDGCGIKVIMQNGLFTFKFLYEQYSYFTEEDFSKLCSYKDPSYHLDKISIFEYKHWYPGKEKRVQSQKNRNL